ncbi:DMT family transporter [Pseudoalteromonas sp. MMG013]|uniref:DMT family transporter n=1 Tax=Pseudoalteromonas sp. MMG013 TaxID=2822687 RepID=UPI001B35911A|nr:DMT family transporter [Pseudoalteromonas sp. MMG013]MBQ4860586.1 DMT family transporter [Pseudoalteromonas sp. MMG013]
MLIKFIPVLFVVLWASGFIGARFGLVYAEPATLLSIRMIINIIFFIALVALLKRHIPKGRAFLHSCVVGLLIHGLYLGGSFQAISLGMPAGLNALLVGIQPILTVIILLVLSHKHFSVVQWTGLLLGFVGITLVLQGNIQWQDAAQSQFAIGMSLLALTGITLGTLYQKRFCKNVDLVGATLVQYIAASCLFIPWAVQFETMQVQWTIEFIATLAWLVLVLSVAAILLLLYMVKQGESESVASVFYLVPPVTALQAWLAFGETFDIYGIAGFICAAFAVYFVVKDPKMSTTSKNSKILVDND